MKLKHKSVYITDKRLEQNFEYSPSILNEISWAFPNFGPAVGVQPVPRVASLILDRELGIPYAPRWPKNQNPKYSYLL